MLIFLDDGRSRDTWALCTDTPVSLLCLPAIDAGVVALFVFILGFSWSLGPSPDHDGMIVFRAASATPNVRVVAVRNDWPSFGFRTCRVDGTR